jgi:N6-L-threonylcarbamoyladenine synthase
MKYTILGIESSCDDTAAAVYTTDKGLVSHAFFTQSYHAQYGGVVPEIASRSHLEKLQSVVQAALEKAHMSVNDINVIAVTNRPGLPGSLLTGVCFAKGLAYAAQKKIIGVNHLEGHAFSACVENQVPFPHLCLTASGGHTSLYLVKGYGDYEVLGVTQDDAAGEAFDKIAKMMGLPYPGGPIIEKLAEKAEFNDFFKYPRLKHRGYDFSFSGLKTAVLYDLVNKNAYDMATKKFLFPDNEQLKQDVASSLLVCIKDIFIDRLKFALERHPNIQAITFVGGVAANNYLKQQISMFAQNKGIPFFSPSRLLCTDNAGMIAFVGHYKAQQGLFSDLTLDIW